MYRYFKSQLAISKKLMLQLLDVHDIILSYCTNVNSNTADAFIHHDRQLLFSIFW